MMLSNSLKRSMVVVAILMSCGAFAQDQAGDIVATIESDDPETLELFLDWAGIRASVRASFRDQGMEMPEGLEDWLAESRGLLMIADGVIAVPTAGAEKREAQNFIDELFHVFRDSAFRQQCIERLYQNREELQRETSAIKNYLRADEGEWRNPEEIAREFLAAKENLFETDLRTVEMDARLRAVRQRLEEHGADAENRKALLAAKLEALQATIESRREEVQATERLVDKELATTDDLRSRLHNLFTLERSLENRKAELESAHLGQDGPSRELKSSLIEAESEFAAAIAGRKLIEKLASELQGKLHTAGEQAHVEAELEAHMRKLAHAMEQLERGNAFPLIPVEGVPQLRLRWVN